MRFDDLKQCYNVHQYGVQVLVTHRVVYCHEEGSISRTEQKYVKCTYLTNPVYHRMLNIITLQ